MNAEELIVHIGRVAERRFGLTVGENPHFGGVTGRHTKNSWHDAGLAIDVTGPANRLAAFNRWVAENYGDTIGELFYDHGVNIDKGTLTSAIGGHGGHVHVATDPSLEPDQGWDLPGVGFLEDNLPGFKAGADALGAAYDFVGDKVGDNAAKIAGEVISQLAKALGVNGPAIALNVALVGGGAFLVYYGVSKAAGVDEPVMTLAARTPAGAAAGVAT